MKRHIRWGVFLAGLVPLALAGVLALSPYGSKPGFPYKLLIEQVDIARPCASVFQYLGNSANASKWSVYVDHITPLNADQVPDGALGSIRRSFRRADETGMRWDELFTVVEPDRRRQLRIYNLVGTLAPRRSQLMTEQLYQPLGPDSCRLGFTVFFDKSPSIPDELALSLVAYKISSIFKSNIGNVRRLVESGPSTASLAGK